MLDTEVAALPEDYRVPFVLHYLEGVSVTEVAQRLRWPRGTVATRLARARARLGTRLARRGVTLSAGALAVLSDRAAANVPAPLAAAAARAAGSALGKGGAKAMMTFKAKVAAAVLLAVGLGAGGVALHGQRATPAIADTEGAAAPVAPTVGAREKLLFLEGSTRFLLGDYLGAAALFARMNEICPDSALAPSSAALRVLSNQLARPGAGDEERKVAEGRRLIARALGEPTADAAAEGGAPAHSDRGTGNGPEEDFEQAELYRRTGKLESACFYYELVCKRYPSSPWAARAAKRRQEVREQMQNSGALPKKDEKPPARVGQILIIGNTRTKAEVVLKAVPLFPGAVLSVADLLVAERNLARLEIFADRPKVSTINTPAPGTFVVVLIEVKEK